MTDLRKDLKGFTGYYIPPSMTDERTVSPQRVNVKVLRDDGDTLLVEYEAGGIGHLMREQFTPEYMLCPMNSYAIGGLNAGQARNRN